jgi:hypothetical protein
MQSVFISSSSPLILALQNRRQNIKTNDEDDDLAWLQ